MCKSRANGRAEKALCHKAFSGGRREFLSSLQGENFGGLKTKKKAPDFWRISLNSSAFYCTKLCKMWRRVWDSNPRAQRANGFQDRLVMTTSITLRRLSLAKCSGIWREFRERTMKFLYAGKCRKPLIWQGFWGNKRNSYARVFKTASLWPLR